MKTLEIYIEAKQKELMDNLFFKELKQVNDLLKMKSYVNKLTFWVMTFQDVLRLNELHVRDPELKNKLHEHRLEDSGHEKWFLHDKKYIEDLKEKQLDNNQTIAWLYNSDSQPIRDATYALVSEIFREEEDLLRVVFLLVLEAAAHIFFGNMVKQVKKIGEDDNLHYFSSLHFNAEESHEMFTMESQNNLFAKYISPNKRRDALKMIDRCFKAFNLMFLGLWVSCHNSA
jgi:hypothetical protein